MADALEHLVDGLLAPGVALGEGGDAELLQVVTVEDAPLLGGQLLAASWRSRSRAWSEAASASDSVMSAAAASSESWARRCLWRRKRRTSMRANPQAQLRNGREGS